MMDVNLEQARFNMIEQQIRPWEVLDQAVLDLLMRVPREDFVPPRYRNLAFADMNISIGHDQVMMAPKVEARLLQALDVQPDDTVLEVGTGSGYLTALLAHLGHHVYSVEIFEDLSASAGERLAAHDLDNVTLETGDAARGWSRHAPYDVIVPSGSVPVLEEVWKQDLAPDGRLFAIVGEPPVMNARLVTRVAEDEWASEDLFETLLPPLVNAPRPQRFVL